jgi:membrane-bound inhibitor of C-type lysozyme
MPVKALPRAGHLSVLFFLLASSCLALPQPPTTQSAAQPKSHRMPVARKFSYACDGGLSVNVTLREQNARVTFRDKSYSMKQVRSGSGVRYSDGKIVWWNKGYDGFLEDETDASHPVKLAENCKQTLPPPKSP